MRFSQGALEILSAGDYPGNVRQLEGVVLRAFLIARVQGSEEIGVEHVPSDLFPHLQYRRRGDREENRLVVERTLRITGGNVKKATELLGVCRNTLKAARRNSSQV